MGSVGTNDRLASDFNSDPASFPAGVAVREKSDGTLSLASTDGQLVGVSLGRSLSDTKRTSVCRTGNRVPLTMEDSGVKASVVKGDLTFTAVAKGVAGNSITIAMLDTAVADGSEVATIVGTAISVSMKAGASTATHVKAALDAVPAIVALITTTISGTAGTAQTAHALAPLVGGVDSFAFCVKGAAVHVDNTTGLACASGGTTTGATYVDGPLTGINEDGTTAADVAIIDMGGGL